MKYFQTGWRTNRRDRRRSSCSASRGPAHPEKSCPEETLWNSRDCPRAIYQNRQCARSLCVQLAQPCHAGAFGVSDDCCRRAYRFPVFQCAAGTARQHHASAESGQSAVVLPGTARNGQLLRFLGRCRHSHARSALLLLVPFLDRKPGGVGKWFAKERLLANSLFMTFVVVNIALMIIGTFFRGPNWEFVSPW